MEDTHVQRGRGQAEEDLLTGDTHLVRGCCEGRGLCQWGLQSWGAGEGEGAQARCLQEGGGPVEGRLGWGWWWSSGGVWWCWRVLKLLSGWKGERKDR